MEGIIQVPNPPAQGVAPNNRNKKEIFTNFTPFINCISEINNAQVDDAHDIDVVMPMYNLIDYCNHYSKTSESLWQYYRDKPALDDNNAIIFFPC